MHTPVSNPTLGRAPEDSDLAEYGLDLEESSSRLSLLAAWWTGCCSGALLSSYNRIIVLVSEILNNTIICYCYVPIYIQLGWPPGRQLGCRLVPWLPAWLAAWLQGGATDAWLPGLSGQPWLPWLPGPLSCCASLYHPRGQDWVRRISCESTASTTASEVCVATPQ